MALPLLDAMVPALTALAQTPAAPVRRLGFVYMPMGCDIAAVDAAGEGTLDGAVADAAVRWRRSRTSVTVLSQPGAAERVSRDARDVELRRS